MRNIIKRTEPASLLEHRLGTHADFDNYPGKDALRTSLVSEQRGLCCYCLQSIRPDGEQMKIEHWHSQARYPEERLTYRNLLGACKGNEGQPEYSQHCDSHKGTKDLTRNPAEPLHNVEALMDHLSDGRVKSLNAEFDAELNEVLNLNAAFLVNSRKSVLNAFQRTLAKRQMTRQSWATLAEKWNGDSDFDDLKPFCNVIVYWIRKTKLRQVNA